MKRRPMLATAACSVLVASGLVWTSPAGAHRTHPGDPAVITDWIELATQTLYPGPTVPPAPPAIVTPVPVGQLYLGFTSMAVLDAVETAGKDGGRSRASTTAAAAVAAHDVLAFYLPHAAADYEAQLAESLGSVPASRAKARGIRIGHAAAAEFLASRIGDGVLADVQYEREPAIGAWRRTPAANAAFAAPWLGFVRPLLLDSPTQIQPNGPDALTSRGYARDYAEVKRMGALTGSDRTPRQTETALFYNDNLVRQIQDGLRDMADRHSLSLERRSRLFAMVNVSAADALITCWRQKFDEALWRPITAINETADDGNPRTEPDPTWQPLVATPPYPDYTSGHACVMGAVTKSLTLLTGSDRIDLNIASVHPGAGPERHYSSARALERDGFHARIWLGLHFRDAMEDGNYIGEKSARIGFHRLF